MLAAVACAALAAAYTPPGVLAQLVDQKRREVERLRKLPEARVDGSWALRLGYPSATASYGLARAIGYRPERPAVLIDLKRSSPGGKLGASESIDPTLSVASAVEDVQRIGATGALVAVDTSLYGGSIRDFTEAKTVVQGINARAAS